LTRRSQASLLFSTTMANNPLSRAAVGRKKGLDAAQQAQTRALSLSATTPPASSTSSTTHTRTRSPSQPQQSRVAFISGHIDIAPQQFKIHYAPALDAAIHRGDAFVLSTARGADTLALDYLRTHNVDPSRVTIYTHAPRPNRKANAIRVRVDTMQLRPVVEERYRKEGYNIKVIQGYHNERDAACTGASDYDILWVRGETETAALYGSKYRPGRISGTQKNRDRRLLKGKRIGVPGSSRAREI